MSGCKRPGPDYTTELGQRDHVSFPASSKFTHEYIASTQSTRPFDYSNSFGGTNMKLFVALGSSCGYPLHNPQDRIGFPGVL